MKTIKVALVGIGGVSRAFVEGSKENIKIVVAFDSDPHKIGKALKEAMEINLPLPFGGKVTEEKIPDILVEEGPELNKGNNDFDEKKERNLKSANGKKNGDFDSCTANKENKNNALVGRDSAGRRNWTDKRHTDTDSVRFNYCR